MTALPLSTYADDYRNAALGIGPLAHTPPGHLIDDLLALLDDADERQRQAVDEVKQECEVAWTEANDWHASHDDLCESIVSELHEIRDDVRGPVFAPAEVAAILRRILPADWRDR